ncbi:MAG: hypothetical protein AB2A00_02085 [Myxococcota bacterium]
MRQGRQPLWVLLLLVSCSSTSGTPPAVNVAAEPCNPLGYGPECLNPFPSSMYLEVDASTVTGRRVRIPQGAAPLSSEGIPVDVTSLDQDGFSPAAPYMVHFPVAISNTALPPQDDIARSLTAESGTVLIDVERRERVPHFSELDMTVEEPGERTLIIRPMRRLRNNARYLVVVTHRVRALDGSAVPRSAGFQAVLDGLPTTSARLESRRASLVEAMEVATQLGLTRDDLLLAFEVHTASQEAITGALLSMREQALTTLGNRGIAYAISRSRENTYPDVARLVDGTFRSPLFLTDEGGFTATLARDASGTPVATGEWDREFTVVVPPKAMNAPGPVPLLIYGHGLLGSGYDEIQSGHVRRLAEELGYVVAATNWTGLTEQDVGIVTNALRDMSLFHRTASRLQQAVIDTIALTRTVRGILGDAPELQRADGSRLIDEGTTYYDGNSLGGIMGLTFLALTPDIERGVVGVGAGNWSMMIQRSANWPAMSLVFDDSYRVPVERQVILAMIQSLWDYADPVSYAPHVVKDPLPGSTVRYVLSQIGTDDAQVPNLASDMVYGTAGLPLLSQSARTPWGFETVETAPSAYVYFGVPVSKTPPPTNEAAEGNETHEAVRRLAAAIEMKKRFLKPDGVVEPTCDGMCDPE